MRGSSPRLLRLPGCAVRAGAGRERERGTRWRRWRCVAAAAVGFAAALTGAGPAWAQVAGDLRLQDGSTALNGRLEVYLSDDEVTFEWGTVCDDEFDAAEVAVVCRQLGHPSVGTHFANLLNIAGTEVPIWMDELQCAGTETRLTDCPRSTEPADCFHREDVWVDCRPVISIQAVRYTVVEGEDALFRLTRSTRAGEESGAPSLEVAVSVTEDGAMISGTPPTGVTFAAGSTSATLTVSTVNDQVWESNSRVTARLTSAAGALYHLERFPTPR